METNVVEVNLSDKASLALRTMLGRVTDYLHSQIPNSDKIETYWLHHDGVLHAIFTNQGLDFEYETGTEVIMEHLTWKSVLAAVDGLAEFIENFQLGDGITVVCGRGAPVHRHPDSSWSFTVMENTCPGDLYFWENKYPEQFDEMYHGFILNPKEVLNLIEEARTDSNGIYSLKTNIWHSWEPDTTMTAGARVYVFYLKNARNKDEVLAAVDEINRKYT